VSSSSWAPLGGSSFAPLQAHRLRHGEGERQTPRSRHEGQGNAVLALVGSINSLPASKAIFLPTARSYAARPAFHREAGFCAFFQNFGQHAWLALAHTTVELDQRVGRFAEAAAGSRGNRMESLASRGKTIFRLRPLGKGTKVLWFLALAWLGFLAEDQPENLLGASPVRRPDWTTRSNNCRDPPPAG